MGKSDLNLLQGTLDVLILKALAEGPLHGYAVAEWIREVSEKTLQVEDGALYTALHRMEKKKWLSAKWGLSETKRRAKYYELTKPGRKQLEARRAQWTAYAQAVFRVLDANKRPLA